MSIIAACFFAIAAVLSSREGSVKYYPLAQLSRLRAVKSLGRIALAGAAALAAIGYVWVTAVRAVPGVRRRKAEARARRAAR